MKTSQRKKIIIGYRYDPQSYTSQRLQQIQSIDDFENDYLPTDSVKKSFESDQKLIEKLRNENSLLKTQLLRVEQKSSFRSYKLLLQQYKQLESQCIQLRQQVQKMKNTLQQFESKQQQRQKKQQLNQTYKVIEKNNKQQQIPYQRNNHISYTFSPYTNVNEIQDDGDDRQQQQQKITYYERMKSIQTNRNTTTDESLQHRFDDTLPREGQNNVDININQLQENHLQSDTQNIQKNYQTFNPAQFKFLNTMIDSEYLYNNLKTIHSEKSQQLQSQIHLGYNFSFMPKPLVKNIKTLQAFQEEETKKASFKNDKNAIFASSQKKMLKKDHQSQQPTYSINVTQKSLCVSQNQSESNIGKLNGLRKLPNKPSRNNQRTSNNSISISDS